MSSMVRLKIGDVGRRIRFRVFSAPGVPMNLTGLTVKLIAKKAGAGAVKFNVACQPEDQDAAATVGFAYYDPAAADIDTAGKYQLEVKVLTGASPVSIPSQGFYELIVSRPLA